MMPLLLVTFLSMSMAQEKKHVHGEGYVSMAFEGKKGKMEIKVPAEILFGFEHSPRNAKERRLKDKALSTLDDKMGEMIVFDENLKCEIRKEISEIIESRKHSDVEAEYDIICEEPILGSTITFNFRKVFPRFKKAVVSVIAEGLQKSIDVKDNGEKLELKQSAD